MATPSDVTIGLSITDANLVADLLRQSALQRRRLGAMLHATPEEARLYAIEARSAERTAEAISNALVGRT